MLLKCRYVNRKRNYCDERIINIFQTFSRCASCIARGIKILRERVNKSVVGTYIKWECALYQTPVPRHKTKGLVAYTRGRARVVR